MPSSITVVSPHIQSYDPLLWLLKSQRLLVLRSHRRIEREFHIRQRRSRLFRLHLRLLTKDFDEATNDVKSLMVQSPRDRPDLASFLIRSRLRFTGLLLMVNLRLWLYRFGFDR